jgi:CheY-like chemotaxis protein
VGSAVAQSHQSEKQLLVDDDADGRAVVSHVLTELGYSVREAANGGDALGALSDFVPDLIIIDFAMPDMNGVQVVTSARAQCSVEVPLCKRSCRLQSTRDGRRRRAPSAQAVSSGGACRGASFSSADPQKSHTS